MKKNISPITVLNQKNSINEAWSLVNFVLDELIKNGIKVINSNEIRIRPIGSLTETSYAFLIEIEGVTKKGLSLLINKEYSVQYGIIYWRSRGWEPKESTKDFISREEFKKRLPEIISKIRR